MRFEQETTFWDVRRRLDGDSLSLEIVDSNDDNPPSSIALNAILGGIWTKVE